MGASKQCGDTSIFYSSIVGDPGVLKISIVNVVINIRVMVLIAPYNKKS